MKTYNKIYNFFSVIGTITLLEVKRNKMTALNVTNICYVHRYQYYW